MYFGFLLILMRKVALKPGSSKQGKALRADSGSNWVAARTLLKNTSIAYANTALKGNTTLIHLFIASMITSYERECAPGVPSVSALISVRAVVETIIGV